MRLFWIEILAYIEDHLICQNILHIINKIPDVWGILCSFISRKYDWMHGRVKTILRRYWEKKQSLSCEQLRNVKFKKLFNGNAMARLLQQYCFVHVTISPSAEILLHSPSLVHCMKMRTRGGDMLFIFGKWHYFLNFLKRRQGWDGGWEGGLWV